MRKDVVIATSLLVVLIIALIMISTIPLIYRNVEKPTSKDRFAEEGGLVSSNITLKRFNSYDELIGYLEKYLNNLNKLSYPAPVGAEPGFATRPPQAPSEVGKDTGTRFSRTNIQVEGVDEPDIVKTNGLLIVVYAYYNNRVFIINSTSDEVVSSIVIDRDKYVNGLFLTNEYLVVITRTSVRTLPYVEFSRVEYDYGLETCIDVYDISNAWNPVRVFTISVSGSIVSSRLMNNTVYVVTQMPIYKPIIPLLNKTNLPIDRIFIITDTPEYYILITSIELKSFRYNVLSFITSRVNWMYMSRSRLYLASTMSIVNIISMYREVCRELNNVLPRDIAIEVEKYLDRGDVSSAYETITSYLSKLNESDVESIVSRVNEFLGKRIYVDKTIFYVFDINTVYINYTGSFSVDGSVLDQFSIEEFGEKYFVVATTSNLYLLTVSIFSNRYVYIMPIDTNESIHIQWTRPEHYWRYDQFILFPEFRSINQSNNVFIIDTSSLEIIGELRNLAIGERIYSARLIKNILYLVTFRTIDPLFAIDLSNPHKPEVLGYLKIPGFSEYLHPISLDKLIGIGIEESCLKISLFDVSNPKNMSEVSKLLIPHTYSQVLHDHRAFTLDPDYSRIYIPIFQFIEIVDESTGEIRFKETMGIVVISFVNNELKLVKFIELRGASRAIYVGEKLYLVSHMVVRIYSVETLEFIKEIDFSTYGEVTETIISTVVP